MSNEKTIIKKSKSGTYLLVHMHIFNCYLILKVNVIKIRSNVRKSTEKRKVIYIIITRRLLKTDFDVYSGTKQ